ncbi:MAG TPA: nicotinate phosphoribosyltransferase, partial [Acidimicrobiia bacterium]|nr:nicotinate phosphoribosyltransferase [Acidimicrobiia bacterium]
LPGSKQVWRRPGFGGDVLTLADEPCPAAGAEPLLVEMDLADDPGDPGAVAAARARFEAEWAHLPPQYRDLSNPTGYGVEVSDRLQALADGRFAPG